ncbi:MAG: hypothetical protein HS108_10375 [Planctomycetes bacterium]|nr:hypothetical protein [Planctomycetota bacterium]
MDWDFRRPGTTICVCYQVTNSQALEAWLSADEPSVALLGRLFHCGNHCALCVPYFETLLAQWRQGQWPTENPCPDASG